MPKGYTTVLFEGGSMNGETIEAVPLNQIAPEIVMQVGETWFGMPSPEGCTDEAAMVIYKGEIDPVLWDSYRADVYTKRDQGKNDSGVVYEHKERIMVQRCRAATKSGKRCKNTAQDEQIGLCKTHLK
ncbi:hypothetical protein ACMXYX_17960 (plasmid) [Neptuniibacter sp. QD72_48]|uniref:hypothetical protein n=1 Tax=Neptuniibacter sp. QD72_48 TaxID=3398214 RepID=UPI0039F51DC3